MRRLSIVCASVLLAIALFAGTMLPTSSINVTAQEIECSWGQIKCCYASEPCVNACCPRPKKDIHEVAYWLPVVIKAAVRVLDTVV